MAEDFVEHAELPPGVPPGREALRALVEALRQAFPDFRYEVLQQHQDGDHHVVDRLGMLQQLGFVPSSPGA